MSLTLSRTSSTSPAGRIAAPSASARATTPDSLAVPGIVLGLFLSLVIAGTLFGGRAVAFGSIPILVLATLYFASKNTSLAIGIFTAYSAMEGMYKYLSYFSKAVYVVKPLLILAIAAIWAFRVRHKHLRTSTPPLGWAAGLLIAWGFVTIFNPTGSSIFSSVATYVVWYLTPALLFFLAYNEARSVEKLAVLAYILVAICAVVSILACVQYAMGQAWTDSHLPGYENVNQGEWWITNEKGSVLSTQWRPASTAAMGGGGGLWSQRGIAVAVAMLLAGRLSTRMKWAMAACLLINIVGTIVSGCRLYLIVALIEVILLVVILPRSMKEWSRNVGAFLLFAILATAGTLIANNITGGTIVDRYSATLADPVGKYTHDRGSLTWRADMMLQVLHGYPFGIGYQRGLDGGRQSDQSGPIGINRDDEFNCLAGDMGIPGLIILCCLTIGMIAVSWRSFASAKELPLRALAGIGYALTIGNLIQFLGGPVLQGNDQFWITAGLLFATPMIVRRAAAPADSYRRMGVPPVSESSIVGKEGQGSAYENSSPSRFGRGAEERGGVGSELEATA